MYGKYVTVGDIKVWVWCSPDTKPEELLRRAIAALKRGIG